MMARRTYGWLALSLLTASAVSAAVIVFGRYYETSTLLVAQTLSIALPTFVPLAIASVRAKHRAVNWIVCIALMLPAWYYVVHVDTRPYQGGGASMAILFGWMGCAVAAATSCIPLLINREHRRENDSRWSKQPEQR